MRTYPLPRATRAQHDAMLTLTSAFAFSAAHHLDSPALDETAKDAAYGPCRRTHGHNYRLEVSVAGDRDERTGFFCNVMALKDIVNEHVVDPWDHRLLNDVPPFTDGITTMERLATEAWNMLKPALAAAGMRLVRLRLGETPEHWVDITDEGGGL